MKKNLSAKKKLFFFKSFEKKMNDKRNLICGNVMLLSQSCGEKKNSAFAKKNFGLSQKRKKNVRSKKNVFNPKITD